VPWASCRAVPWACWLWFSLCFLAGWCALSILAVACPWQLGVLSWKLSGEDALRASGLRQHRGATHRGSTDKDVEEKFILEVRTQYSTALYCTVLYCSAHVSPAPAPAEHCL